MFTCVYYENKDAILLCLGFETHEIEDTPKSPSES